MSAKKASAHSARRSESVIYCHQLQFDARLDGRTSTAVAVYTLERLFHRPVFRRELQEMKLAETPELKLAPATVIAEARRILSKAGYRLPDNEPAYLVEGSYENEFRAILVALVSTGFRLSHLSLDTKQLTL